MLVLGPLKTGIESFTMREPSILQNGAIGLIAFWRGRLSRSGTLKYPRCPEQGSDLARLQSRGQGSSASFCSGVENGGCWAKHPRRISRLGQTSKTGEGDDLRSPIASREMSHLPCAFPGSLFGSNFYRSSAFLHSSTPGHPLRHRD